MRHFAPGTIQYTLILYVLSLIKQFPILRFVPHSSPALCFSSCGRYLCEGASCLRSHLKEKQQQFEEVQNGLDLVGFETEVC